MARESYLFYCDVDELLHPAVEPMLDRCGYLFLAEGDDELAGARASASPSRTRSGVPSELLDPEQAGEIAPGLAAESLAGAAYCREDGYFDRPQAVVAGFSQAAQQLGVGVITEFVTAISPDGGGWRWRFADGSSRLAEQVVVAAAQASAALLAPLGVALPIEEEARYLFYSDPVRERLLEPLVMSSERHFAAKQLADGSVLASDLSAVGDPDDGKARWYSHVRRTITGAPADPRVRLVPGDGRRGSTTSPPTHSRSSARSRIATACGSRPGSTGGAS